jgi:hypothetical protein
VREDPLPLAIFASFVLGFPQRGLMALQFNTDEVSKRTSAGSSKCSPKPENDYSMSLILKRTRARHGCSDPAMNTQRRSLGWI